MVCTASSALRFWLLPGIVASVPPDVSDSIALLQTARSGPDEAHVRNVGLSFRSDTGTGFDDQMAPARTWAAAWTAQQSASKSRSERTFGARAHVSEGESAFLQPQMEAESAAILEARAEAVVVRRRVQGIAELSPSAKKQVLVNYGDVQYVTHFRMGQQTIVGILDTGSFELVVFSKACKSCGPAAKYDPKMSPGHVQGKLMTMQSYGSGDTYSTQAFDSLSMGPYEETNQSFWEVIGARMPILATSAFEAIIGIGPPETPAVDAWQDAQEAIKNVSTVYTEGMKPSKAELKYAKESLEAALEVSRSPTMLDNLHVGSFSLCLGAEPGSDGYLIWNDTSAFDMPQLFRRVPIIGKHTWSVRLSNVELTGGDGRSSSASFFPGHTGPFACQEGCVALLDSGTSLLAVPGNVITWLSRELSRLSPDCSNIESLPDLVITLGEHRFTLPPDAYVAEVKGSVPKYLQNFVRMTTVKANTTARGECQLLLMESFAESQHGPFWILGMPFFRRYYTTFFIGESTESRSLYVAPASDDCTPSSTPPTSLSSRKAYKRLIDPNKVHVPNVVQKAHWQRSIVL